MNVLQYDPSEVLTLALKIADSCAASDLECNCPWVSADDEGVAGELVRGGGDKTVIVEGVRHPDGRVVIYDVRELEPSCDATGHHDKYCRLGECQYAEIGLPRCAVHAQGGAPTNEGNK